MVAAEVKSLANQTASATEKISKQVEPMQVTTSAAVTSVGEIGTIVARIDDIANAIATAVEEQSAVTGGIARDINDTSTASEGVSQKIDFVAATLSAVGTPCACLKRFHFSPNAGTVGLVLDVVWEKSGNKS